MLAAAEAICGNMVVEEGEECDCGYDDDESCRQDHCCQGRPSKSGSDNTIGCKLYPDKTCRLVCQLDQVITKTNHLAMV